MFSEPGQDKANGDEIWMDNTYGSYKAPTVVGDSEVEYICQTVPIEYDKKDTKA